MNTATRQLHEGLKLSADEIAFLRFTCNAFFLPESPLHVFEAEKREPKSFAATHETLVKKSIIDANTWHAKEAMLQPLAVVAECDARVLWQKHHDGRKTTRDFYVSNGRSVEFSSDGHFWLFGSPRREQDVVNEVIRQFEPAPAGKELVDMIFSPGEYLVFAVFARDVRAAKVDKSDHMTLEEVLACFEDDDEPSSVPRDSDFVKHTEALAGRGLLHADGNGNYRLDKSLHGFARGLSSEKYDAFTRYDFIDDEWLIRETTIYPVPNSIFLISSLHDGSVSVQELDEEQLFEVLAQAIATLPDISDDPLRPRQARDFFLQRA